MAAIQNTNPIRLIFWGLFTASLLKIIPPGIANLPSDSILITSINLGVLAYLISTLPHRPNVTISPNSLHLFALLIGIQILKLVSWILNNENNTFGLFFLPEFALESSALSIIFASFFFAQTNKEFEITKYIFYIHILLISGTLAATLFSSITNNPLGNPNYTGAALAILSPLSLSYLHSKPKHTKILSLFLILTTITILLFVLKHRIGLVATIISISCYYYIGNRGVSKKTIPAGIIIAAILVASAIYVKQPEGTTHSNAIERLLNSGSFVTRIDQAKLAIELIQEKALFGYGSGLYLEKSTLAANRYPGLATAKGDSTLFHHPHNDMIETAFEGGVLSLMAYLLFLAKFIFYLYKETSCQNKKYNKISAAVLSSVVATIAIGLGSIANQTPAVISLTALIIGLGLSTISNNETNKKRILGRNTIITASITVVFATAIAIKNDANWVMINYAFSKNDFKTAAEKISESKSFYSISNGLFRLSQIGENELAKRTINTLSTKMNPAMLNRNLLYSEYCSSKKENNILESTLIESLKIHPEDSITIASSLLYSAYSQDYAGILASIKKSFSKSIIHADIKTGMKNYSSFIQLNKNIDRIFFLEDKAVILISEDTLKYIINQLVNSTTIEESGIMTMALLQRFEVLSSTEDQPIEKAKAIEHFFTFISLVSARSVTPYW